MQKLRIIAMLSLIIFGMFVATNNALTARTRWKKTSLSGDSVSKWEKRIKPVLNHVPSNVNIFGYVADWDVPGAKYDIIDQDQEYVLTQYALAPHIVQPGLDHEWIIGNFTVQGFQDWLDKNLSSYKMINIGFGIYIIHRTSL